MESSHERLDLPSITAGMAAIMLTFGAARDAQRRCDSMRLAAVDRKLQLIMDHLGIAERDQYLPKVIAHLAQGRRVQTVKAYRCRPGSAPRRPWNVSHATVICSLTSVQA
jgi:hypothetical protein